MKITEDITIKKSKMGQFDRGIFANKNFAFAMAVIED